MRSHTIITLLVSAASVVAGTDCGPFIPGVSSSAADDFTIKTEGVSGATTTYLIECLPQLTPCPYGSGGATVVAAPSFVDLMFSNSEMSMSQECTYKDSTIAICTINEVSPQFTLMTTETITMTMTNTCPGSVSSGAPAAGGATPSANTATATGSGSGTGSSATGGSSTSTNAAMPQLTRAASWGVGAAAVAVAMAVV